MCYAGLDRTIVAIVIITVSCLAGLARIVTTFSAAALTAIFTAVLVIGVRIVTIEIAVAIAAVLVFIIRIT